MTVYEQLKMSLDAAQRYQEAADAASMAGKLEDAQEAERRRAYELRFAMLLDPYRESALWGFYPALAQFYEE